jgi:hypothetical protein
MSNVSFPPIFQESELLALYPETCHIIHFLRHLNAIGMKTHSSQPSSGTDHPIGMALHQRAFVYGFLSPRAERALRRRLRPHKQWLVFFHPMAASAGMMYSSCERYTSAVSESGVFGAPLTEENIAAGLIENPEIDPHSMVPIVIMEREWDSATPDLFWNTIIDCIAA